MPVPKVESKWLQLFFLGTDLACPHAGMARVLAAAAFLAILLSQSPCLSTQSSPRPLSLRGLPRSLEFPALRGARGRAWKLVGLRGGEEDAEDEVDDEEEDALLDDVGLDPVAVEGLTVDLADLDDVEIPPFVMRVTHPWRQPRGKWMVSLVNSYTNASSKRYHLWEIDLRFAPGLHPGWGGTKSPCSGELLYTRFGAFQTGDFHGGSKPQTLSPKPGSGGGERGRWHRPCTIHP